MSTGQNIIDEIRDELQDTTSLSFGTAELLRYINRGAKEFCATTGCLQDTQTINTDGSTVGFLLSTYCTNLVVVFVVKYAGVPLSQTFVHEQTYKIGASVGTPTNWYEFKGVLYLDLIPTTATGGANALTVYYLRTPVDMSAVSSTFDFPDEWDSAIVQYAIARCHHSNRDTVLEATHMAKYEAMRQTAFAINKHKLMGDAK